MNPSQDSQPNPTESAITSVECSVTHIPLSPPLDNRSLELSGAAWFGDHLVLLPQYPSRFDDRLFALPKQEILDLLDKQTTSPLQAVPIPFDAGNLARTLPGFEGFEAIAFDTPMDNGTGQSRVYLTIEASSGFAMVGYLVTGFIEPDLSQLRLEVASQSDDLTTIEPQTDISNKSDEALLLVDGQPVTIYEANGLNVNPAPQAHRFNQSLALDAIVPMPNIEYRITDATAVDEANRFWAINYFFPGDNGKLQPATDPLRAKYGAGQTHNQWKPVERLVEFQYTPREITLVERPPVQLTLLPDDEARNWEGIVRLPEMDGFLLVTDKFPDTILAFVPLCN